MWQPCELLYTCYLLTIRKVGFLCKFGPNSGLETLRYGESTWTVAFCAIGRRMHYVVDLSVCMCVCAYVRGRACRGSIRPACRRLLVSPCRRDAQDRCHTCDFFVRLFSCDFIARLYRSTRLCSCTLRLCRVNKPNQHN